MILAKKVYNEQITTQGWKGLFEEVTEICLPLSIADAGVVHVSMGQINMARRKS